VPKQHFNSKPTMGKIIRIREECEDTRSFWIELHNEITKIKPGQFIMLWVPGVDEFPIGVAGYKGNILELCITKVGEGTTALFNLKEGDLVGIRGFYGKGFRSKTGITHIIVGGGFGMPPLKFLVEDLLAKERNEKIIVFQGARSKDLLLYLNYFEKLNDEGKVDFRPYTDDGSYGTKGFPTIGVQAYLEKHGEPIIIYSAGPEIMMKVLYDLGKKFSHVVDMQMSLADRHMRCGFGLCGACVVDPTGLRICVDGPVFSTHQLEKIEDFGKYARTPSGEKERI